MRDLAAGLYEICPDCQGECDGCLACMDTGLIEHECSPDEDQ
jgi:hypothetical protein